MKTMKTDRKNWSHATRSQKHSQTLPTWIYDALQTAVVQKYYYKIIITIAAFLLVGMISVPRCLQMRLNLFTFLLNLQSWNGQNLNDVIGIAFFQMAVTYRAAPCPQIRLILQVVRGMQLPITQSIAQALQSPNVIFAFTALSVGVCSARTELSQDV